MYELLESGMDLKETGCEVQAHVQKQALVSISGSVPSETS